MRFGKYNFTGITFLNTIGALVVLYLTVKVGQTVKHNYDLGQQITQLNAQVALLQAQKNQLSYQLAYDGTTSYQQKQAHSQLNLEVPGETEVVLPSRSPTPAPPTEPTVASATAKRSNWSQWTSFLSGGN